ncbi:protein unc-80 homolog isoform X1 [Saccostrea echinata]|uniref:protein unc-80 homolog isoform X1 n=1 Tax=Saccostrea echinata TaxID=191078 RepID=UPI002A831D09|nr:protein unc-80 homolog isoform X1 [Saccostrea echinata]
MPKRKNHPADDSDGDQTIPLPIQSFFWRQTSPFIRPKLGKLCEAACVSLERVVVQNILHGLSPSLCEAIQSVPRWKVIQAAFPHVMHACAALIQQCKQSDRDTAFGPSEVKLLYILHWIILDAASECEDLETDPTRSSVPVQLHSLCTVQLLVYLLAPVIHLLKDSDFQTLKLENGLRFWQPLWDFRQPDIPCFSTPVKPQRNILKAQRNLLKVNTNAANIYVGKGTSRENLNFLPEPPTASRKSSFNDQQSIHAPLARMSDICPMSTADSHSVNMEVLCEHCNNVISSRDSEEKHCQCKRKESTETFVPILFNFQMLPSSVDEDLVKQRLASAVTSGIRGPTAPDILSASYFDVAVLRCLFSLHWSEDGVYWALKYVHQRLLEVCDEYVRRDYSERERSHSLPFQDFKLLRSQSIPSHGIEKSLVKLKSGLKKPSSRLETIPSAGEISPLLEHKFRSNQESDASTDHALKKIRTSSAGDNKSQNAKEMKPMFYLSGSPTKEDSPHSQLTNEYLNFEKMRKKGLRYNERIYEQYLTRKDDSPSTAAPTTQDLDQDPSSKGQKSVSFPPFLTKKETTDAKPKHLGSDRDSLMTSSHSSSSSQLGDSSHAETRTGTEGRSDVMSSEDEKQKPMIMVTEHGVWDRQRIRNTVSKPMEASNGIKDRKGDIFEKNNATWLKDTAQRDKVSAMFFMDDQPQNQKNEKENSLPRSMTDSDINYSHVEEVHEVPGSVHYIQDNGHLNYKVILQAIHFNALNQATPRVCEVLLNIINCLLDLDIVERKQDVKVPDSPESKKTEEDSTKSTTSDSSQEQSAHGLAMDSLFSIFKALGCPNGCGDGLRGSYGDHLRLKGHKCLQRLQQINSILFRVYLKETVERCSIQETVDFLHALLGFCSDPTLILQQGQGQERKRSCTQQDPPVNGFHNNFGHSIGGVGYRGEEGVLIANILKPFVSKCVDNARELYGSDNICLFCDIRQLMTYVKEVHGGTFRRVELSGLLDSTMKLKKQEKESKVRSAIGIRRTTSQTSESGDDIGKTSTTPSEDPPSRSKGRKSIFKKKLKKSLALQPYATASDSELLEDSKNKNATTDDESVPNTSSTGRRRFSRFHLGFRRPMKPDHEEEAMSDPPPLDRRESKSDLQTSRMKSKMSFKTASQATITFLSARKRIEGGLKSLGKRMSKRGSVDDWKQKEIAQVEDAENDSIIVKEKKLVDKFLIKSGMLRFSFLLECAPPGAIPDPQLVAAMLELEAPVVARAALLLECAQFIHRCNHGDWPNWMRLNLPSFRQSTSALQNRGQPSGYRRTLALQKSAGRMFYKWAENLGSMMEYILSKEYKDRLNIISDVHSESRKRELRISDEEEDFLDEGTVNEKGSECPYALKMAACLVLQEITTFLRETFRDLPKGRGARQVWDRPTSATRRWSSIVSSPGHSQSSESNMADIPHSSSAVVGSPSGDNSRKISFAVLGERSDSLHSSTTSISMMADPSVSPNIHSDDKKGRKLATTRPKIKLFRGGSGNNSSFRLKKGLQQKHGSSFKRYGSQKSRKVSSQSQFSDRGTEEDVGVEDTESLLSDENEAPDHDEPNDVTLCHNMPWIKVVVQLANLSNFICSHQNFCHPNCYERQRRSCSRLITALKKIYQSTENEEEEKKQETKKDFLKERLKRRGSIFQQTSPTWRRESTPLLEKIKTDVSMTKLKMTSTWKKEDKPKEIKEDSAMIKYITSQAQKLTQCPMGIIAKAAPILSEENLIDIIPVAWELILETDQELAASAASVFLLTSVKCPDKAQKLIVKEMQHEDTTQRINAILRFGTLWKFRHQVWPRMEDGANMFFKVPPPNIDFTLPSPTIGLPSQTVVDPPWTPHFKAKIEEVTVNQEGTKSLVTATTTRRKEQQEMIRKAFQAEEERKRVGRERFPMTTIPVNHLAAYEPAIHHGSEEHEEAVMTDELSNLAARRVSMAPINRANLQSRSMSWRNGSVYWARLEGEEERPEHLHHMQQAQTFFPSCICAAVLPVIHLLADGDVNSDGVSVNEVAEKVIWNCMVEDPVLFLRHFLEKLTHRDKLEELLFLMRKLVLHYKELPAQMAHALFNYLIGYVMFYVRSPCAGSQEAIAGALALVWQVIPSVDGIYFKDLKQTLKKEQCDPYILISANVPSAKKILIHGPDEASIPSQLPIHEDTQFSQILQDSLDFFNIPEEDYPLYFLVDTKSNQIHNLNSYVRDFYFFRRNFYPQLSLVAIDPDNAMASLERQAFTLKFVEIGKILFTTNVLKSTPLHQIQNHVSFLHEELLKLPSFPRKALEAEFSLYNGKGGEEIYGLDTLHKFSWVKLIATLFSSMSNSFSWSNDLQLFLNVINGCIILHCEDTALLRFCLASLINTSRHFKHVFSMNGFMHVMPTLLKTYSNNQPNPVLCQAIEFVCRQFYILHRKPFILQMFGSIANMLDMTSKDTGMIDCRKIQPGCLFKLLLSLEKPDCADNLSVLELVDGEKPLQALDFCYENDPDRLSMIEVINLCVTVIAYAPDSFRSVQMLTILEVVVSKYVQHVKSETIRVDKPHAAQAEVSAINDVGIAMRALISSCEYFTRSMALPRQIENEKANPKSVASNHSPLGGTSYYDDREDSHISRHVEEGRKKQYTQETEDTELTNEFRKPRDLFLTVIAEFYSTCQPRLRSNELRRMLVDAASRPPTELLDHKSHNRLAEIANTLLKLAPYDPQTLSCTGLQRYMMEILPLTNWKQEAVRPGLNLILRRLDRLFNKISKKSSLRRQADWNAAANLLQGVFSTMRKNPDLSHFQHTKTFVNALLVIVLAGPGAPVLPDTSSGIHGSHRSEFGTVFHIVPPAFCSAVVKLVAMQMQALGDQFSLEQICGGSVFSSHEKCINMLVNFILPLCIRLGCARRGDTPKLRSDNVSFALTVILNVLCPPARIPQQHQQNSTAKSVIHHMSFTENHRCSSFGQADKIHRPENQLLLNVAYLGLEILMVCFDRILSSEWHKVTKVIQDIGSKGKVSLPLWRFVDFLVTHRPSCFLMLQPFILYKMMKINCDTAQEYYLQQAIKDKMQGFSFSHPKCSATVLLQLAVDLQHLKEEFYNVGEVRSLDADLPHNQYEQRASVTDIAIDLIGLSLGPTLAAGGKFPSATILSQPSSSTSPPFKATAVASSIESDSPTHTNPKASRRISAKENLSILERFRKPTMDDISPLDSTGPEVCSLSRQPAIYRSTDTVSRQSSIDEAIPPAVMYHANELETPNGLAKQTISPDLDPKIHRLQRQDVRSRKTFKRKKATKAPSMKRLGGVGDDLSEGEAGSSESSPARRTYSMRRTNYDSITSYQDRSSYVREISRSHQGFTSHPGFPEMSRMVNTRSSWGSGTERSRAQHRGSLAQSEHGPHSARGEVKTNRQRYIQRSKSHDDPHGDQNAPSGSARGRIARQGGRIVHSRSPSSSPARGSRQPIDWTTRAQREPIDGTTIAQRELIDETTRAQREPIDGTTRAESGTQNSQSQGITSPIVRRPAKRVKSPTSPPLGYRMSSPPSSPIHRSQAYISRYDSSDSLNANESSALIKDENDSSRSQSSVCIYFDDFGIKDTLV